MHIFLNGRMVRTYRLYKAVQDGYEGLLPDGRYPICVLNVEMDPHLLDVNVHPSKWEVRISKEMQLEVLLKDGVRKALFNEEVIDQVKPEPITYYQPISFEREDLERVEKPSVLLGKEKPVTTVASEVSNMEAIRNEAKEDEEILRALQKKMEEKKEKTEKEEIPVFPSMQVIGQFRKRYILCECEKGMAVIDAHEARRKCTYEKVFAQLENRLSWWIFLFRLPFTLRMISIRESKKSTGF